jgi:hypothetical protein
MSDKHRWPFDPMQPGDHEPVQLPEELERVQKQTGAGKRTRSDPMGEQGKVSHADGTRRG